MADLASQKGALKMREWKTWHQSAGMENAGVAIKRLLQEEESKHVKRQAHHIVHIKI